jgi:hypothetical protein
VAGLGRLLADLLGPMPPRGLRPSERRRAASWRALQAIADQARDEREDARPSLASLTRSIRRAAPGATLPGSPDVQPVAASAPSRGTRDASPRRPSAARSAPRRSPAPLVAVAGMLVVGATTYLGLSALWSSRPDQRAGATSVQAERARTTTTRATIATSTTARPTPTTAPPTTTTTSTTSPSAPATTAPGAAPEGSAVVVHEGRRYAVGAPGDVVVVGPWRCDGVELPAVLRTADGTVSVFDTWAPPGGQATARAVATLAGASGLTVVADGPGCAVLAVTGPTGPLTTLTLDDLT